MGGHCIYIQKKKRTDQKDKGGPNFEDEGGESTGCGEVPK